jgi:hypothetical protein
VAKPNYQHEKRARELAKKQKKEEKLKRRQEHAAHPEGSGETPEGGIAEGTDTSPAPELGTEGPTTPA